jgi:hypothetical protein
LLSIAERGTFLDEKPVDLKGAPEMKVLSILCAVMALLVTASAANATTTTVSPGGATTITGTTGVMLTVTSGTTVKSLTCDSEFARATLSSSVTSLVGTMQLVFPDAGGSCRLVGGASTTIACTTGTVLTATGATVSGVTPLMISGISCILSLTAAPTCRVNWSGSLRASYSNATHELRWLIAGQSLAQSGSTCTATLPNGSMSWTADTTPANDLLLLTSPLTTINVV